MQDVMSNKYIYVYYISTLLGLIKLNGAVVTTFSDWFSTWWLVSCFTRFRYHNLEIFIMVKRLWLHKTAAEKPMSSVSGHSLLIDNSSARMKWSTKAYTHHHQKNGAPMKSPVPWKFIPWHHEIPSAIPSTEKGHKKSRQVWEVDLSLVIPIEYRLSMAIPSLNGILRMGYMAKTPWNPMIDLSNSPIASFAGASPWVAPPPPAPPSLAARVVEAGADQGVVWNAVLNEIDLEL